MKHRTMMGIFFLAALGAYAFPGPEATYLPAEVKAIEADLGTKTLGNLTVSDLVPVAQRLDIARQKDEYLLVAGGLSMVWPGAGQFLAGDWASGSLHTGLHLGVSAASLAWAHSLLPADLRWGSLDYWSLTEDEIQSRWKAHTWREYLPSIGALAAGGAVDLALRIWSARSARDEAKARIDSGQVTFEPRFDGGHWGFGLRY